MNWRVGDEFLWNDGERYIITGGSFVSGLPAGPDIKMVPVKGTSPGARESLCAVPLDYVQSCFP